MALTPAQDNTHPRAPLSPIARRDLTYLMHPHINDGKPHWCASLLLLPEAFCPPSVKERRRRPRRDAPTCDVKDVALALFHSLGILLEARTRT